MTLSAVLLIALLTSAQPPGGAVTGVVTVTGADQQALVIPGVSVTLTCDGAVTIPAVVTDEQGAFRFDGIPESSCVATAELPGFKPATRPVLVAGVIRDVNMTLVLDSVRVEVTVNGHAEPVEGRASRAPSDWLPPTCSGATRQRAVLAAAAAGPRRGARPDGQINATARLSQSGWRFNSATRPIR